MTAWIKMRSNLDSDPRVIALASELGIPEMHVIGCLWKVWSWADSHSLDGNAIRVTDVTLDRFTAVTGFAAALRKVGWLEGRDNALTFPRFAEHNGQTAKKRGETAIRVAKCRNAKAVTDVTQKVLPDKRRGDKRRVDKKEKPPPLFTPSDLIFPDPLDAKPFRELWELWEKHRSELKHPLKPTMRTGQLEMLAGLGIDAATAMVKHTISMGWQGLRAPEVPRPAGAIKAPAGKDYTP